MALRRCGLLVLGFLLASATAAAAQPKRKVSIDSEPRGASIYVGEKESGSLGVTPLTVELPAGDTIVIIELANHVPKFETIAVPKGKGKAVKVLVKLEPAAAAIIVEADGPLRGARVVVDGEEEGAAPGRVEVSPGNHRVEVVSRSGKTLHSEEVAVTAGAEVTVSVRSSKTKGGKEERPEATPSEADSPPVKVAKGKRRPPPAPPSETDDPSEPSEEAEKKRLAVADEPEPDPEEKDAAAARRADEPARVLVAPLFEVSWRYFDYANPITTQNTASLNQMGTLLFGARAEVVPVRALDSLVLHFAGGYAVPQDLASAQGMLRATVWRADAAATYRLRLGAKAGLLALAGYSRSRYRFEGAAAAVALVPDATYSQVRLGVGVSGRLDWLEMVALIENRPVLSGGVLANRFRSASADGLAGQLIVLAHLGPRYFARVDGGVARFDWSFTYEEGDAYRAEGALDLMLALSLSAGASF